MKYGGSTPRSAPHSFPVARSEAAVLRGLCRTEHWAVRLATGGVPSLQWCSGGHSLRSRCCWQHTEVSRKRNMEGLVQVQGVAPTSAPRAPYTQQRIRVCSARKSHRRSHSCLSMLEQFGGTNRPTRAAKSGATPGPSAARSTCPPYTQLSSLGGRIACLQLQRWTHSRELRPCSCWISALELGETWFDSTAGHTVPVPSWRFWGSVL